MTAKQFLKMVGLCICLLGLPGCWDYQKINDRAQISAVGVEPIDNDPKSLLFTLQIPIFSTSGGGPGSSQESQSTGGSNQYRNFNIVAQNLHDAVAQAQTQYEKAMYLGNIHVILLDHRLSTSQVRHAVGEFMRTPNLERLAFLLFTDQAPKDILQAKKDLSPADSIDRHLGSSVKQHGYTTRTRLWEFWRDSQTIGRQAYTGKIRLGDNSGLDVGGMFVPANQGQGISIKLQPKQTLYFNFIGRQVRNTSMTVRDGERSFEIGNLRSKSKLDVSLNQGRVNDLQAVIHVSGEIVQDENDGEVPLGNADIHRYERIMAQEIENGTKQILNIFQQKKVDAFDFGEQIIKKDPEKVQYVRQQWSDDFAHAKTSVDVIVHLRRKGTLM